MALVVDGANYKHKAVSDTVAQANTNVVTQLNTDLSSSAVQLHHILCRRSPTTVSIIRSISAGLQQ